MKKTLCLLLVCFAVTACKTNPPVSGLNDPLEPVVSISSASFSQPLMLIFRSVDPFFRGTIVKDSKAYTNQMYIRVNSGNAFENWSKVAFLKEGELIELNAERVSFDTDGKARYEDVVVNLSLADLEWLAKQQETNLRIKSGRTNGVKIDFAIKGEEAAKYLQDFNQALNALR